MKANRLGRWLRRATVFVVASTGPLVHVPEQVQWIWQQQHCEPLLRR